MLRKDLVVMYTHTHQVELQVCKLNALCTVKGLTVEIFKLVPDDMSSHVTPQSVCFSAELWL